MRILRTLGYPIPTQTTSTPRPPVLVASGDGPDASSAIPRYLPTDLCHRPRPAGHHRRNRRRSSPNRIRPGLLGLADLRAGPLCPRGRVPRLGGVRQPVGYRPGVGSRGPVRVGLAGPNPPSDRPRGLVMGPSGRGGGPDPAWRDRGAQPPKPVAGTRPLRPVHGPGMERGGSPPPGR